MNVTTLRFSTHDAYLCPTTGSGLLVCPRTHDDLHMGGTASLHASGWDAALRVLAGMTYEPDHEGDYVPMVVGQLADGRDVLALVGDSIVSVPSVKELMEAHGALCEAAGLSARGDGPG